jgi:hypothetical protein
MTEPRNIADGFIARGARLLVSEVAEDDLEETARGGCARGGGRGSGLAGAGGGGGTAG